jgi:hypothetical protein
MAPVPNGESEPRIIIERWLGQLRSFESGKIRGGEAVRHVPDVAETHTIILKYHAFS